MTDNVPERVDAIESKLDALSSSVDKRFDAVDQRFDLIDKRFQDVTSAIVEQREYTEFAFDRLRGEMRDGFDRLDGRIGRLEQRFGGLEQRFGGLEQRVGGIEQRMATREQLGHLEQLTLTTADGIGRLERKLDQFIESFSTRPFPRRRPRKKP